MDLSDTLSPEVTAALVDLLCGAAASDTDVATTELARLTSALAPLIGAPLPEEVQTRIAGFDGARFDLAATLAALSDSDEGTRKMALEAVVDIVCADRFVDSSELDFIAEVALGLGLPVPRIG